MAQPSTSAAHPNGNEESTTHSLCRSQSPSARVNSLFVTQPRDNFNSLSHLPQRLALTREEGVADSTDANTENIVVPMGIQTPPAIEPSSRNPDSGLHCHKFHKTALSIEKVAHKVFDVMRENLRKESDCGYIYVLSISDRPGLVKIGRTKNPIDKRAMTIKKCYSFELIAANDDDFCIVPNHTKVEKLVHAELRNRRRKVSCTRYCKKPHDVAVESNGNGTTQHGEWFEIDVMTAYAVVERWRKWMRSSPYNRNGRLRRLEELRITIYRSDPAKMKLLGSCNGGDSWQWDKFMAQSRIHLWFLDVRNWVFEERIKRSTCSRWDSWWEHWRANMLFVFLFYVSSWMIPVPLFLWRSLNLSP